MSDRDESVYKPISEALSLADSLVVNRILGDIRRSVEDSLEDCRGMTKEEMERRVRSQAAHAVESAITSLSAEPPRVKYVRVTWKDKYPSVIKRYYFRALHKLFGEHGDVTWWRLLLGYRLQVTVRNSQDDLQFENQPDVVVRASITVPKDYFDVRFVPHAPVESVTIKGTYSP